MSTTISDRTILVTGANRGIGKAVVEALLAAGAAKVYTAVRDPASAEPLVQAHGARVVPLHLDLRDSDSVAAAAATAADVDVVINNAGVLRTSDPLAADTFEALEYEFDVNVRGLLRVARAFAPVLAGKPAAAFVQLNSVASITAFASFGTYSASKAAAYSLTQSLRDVLAPQGIHVLSVHPGPIATDMADQAGLSEIGTPPEGVATAIVDGLAAGAFHVFPDPMAQQVWTAYQGFAENVVEADLMEA